MITPSPAVTVSAWIGSRNSGDELVHAGLRHLLAERGATVSAVSVDIGTTVARHGGAALTRRRAVASFASGHRTDALVLGGGGLLQDQTSAANLPYHLLPVMAARLRGRPVAGIGLGAGPVSSLAGRRLLGRSLAGIDLTVRDGASADVLAGLGLPRPSIGADLSLTLPEPSVDALDDVLAVALRPWDPRRHHLPVALRRRSPPPGQVDQLAAAVDAVAGRLGLPVRFVAFDTHKDDAVHRAVAERLHADVVDLVAPDPFDALAAVAGARAVFAMRYHAGIAALLGRRPAVLVPYDPKVGALAADVGTGFGVVPSTLPDPAAAADAAARAVEAADTGVLDEALAGLRARGAANAAALDRLLAAGPGS